MQRKGNVIMKVLKKIIMWTLLALCSIFIISFLCMIVEEKDVFSRDEFLTNLSILLMFVPFEIGLMLELNFGGVKNKIAFLNSSKVQNHILLWVIIF